LKAIMFERHCQFDTLKQSYKSRITLSNFSLKCVKNQETTCPQGQFTFFKWERRMRRGTGWDGMDLENQNQINEKFETCCSLLKGKCLYLFVQIYVLSIVEKMFENNEKRIFWKGLLI